MTTKPDAVDLPPSARDLTREKTLYQLWRTSFKFPKKNFNLWVSLAVCAGLMGYCVLAWDRPDALMAAFRKLEATGFGFATSILGFLVAGFTIFVTVIRVEIFVKMAQTVKKGTGESTLKYNLSAFIVTFVHYICYLFVCLLCEMFLPSGGAASLALAKANEFEVLRPAVEQVHKFGAAALVVAFGSWTIYLVLLLKSFVYNVYQVTTTVVRWEWEHPKPAQESAAPPGAKPCDPA